MKRSLLFLICSLILWGNAAYADKKVSELTDGSGSATASWIVICDSTSATYKCTVSSLLSLLTSTQVISAFGSGSCSGYLKSDGSCDIPAASSIAWGSVTGTLSDQTDLKNALDAKVSSSEATTYTEPGSNGPLCRTGEGAVGACTTFTDDTNAKVKMVLNATNATYSGITLYFAKCAASMGFGQPAYIQSTGKPGLADADAAATMPAIGLVVMASTDADTPCTILTHGVITATAWNWIPGNLIYVADGDAGAITATLADISDTDDVVQVVGVAIHADSIFVNPSLTTITLE